MDHISHDRSDDFSELSECHNEYPKRRWQKIESKLENSANLCFLDAFKDFTNLTKVSHELHTSSNMVLLFNVKWIFKNILHIDPVDEEENEIA